MLSIFALRQLQERYREGQDLQDLLCVFIDLKKAHAGKNCIGACERRVCREKYTRPLNAIYHQCETVVRCAAGAREHSAVEVGLHQ